MLEERKALGKGLSSLIPMGGRWDGNSKVYLEVLPADVVPNQSQPRKLFEKNSIDELASSIAEKGILQPLLVRKLGGGKYELIAGERRLRAAQQLHLEKIPVIVKEVEQKDSLELALIENIQRQDLNPIEEALAFRELITRYQYTQDELAKKLSKDRSNIANTMRLLKLPEDIRSKIISGQLSMGHARAILGIENHEIQMKVADAIIKNELSVREIENWIRNLKTDITKVETQKKVVVSAEEKKAEFKNLEEELVKALKTRVQIKSMGGKGTLVIHFANAEDLNRIYQAIVGKG